MTRWDRRDRKRRKRMPVHGKSIEHIIKAVFKRAKEVRRAGR